jgi:uncharacterized protein (DUF1499 family)
MPRQPFPIDFSTLEPDRRPRRWLVLPAGFDAAAEPDQVSPVFPAAPAAALETFVAAGLAQPRVKLLRREGGQAELVQRSLVFRFPDHVTVEAFAADSGRSALAVYSRAVVGRYDFRVNEKRVKAWLEETARRLDGA